MRTIKFRVWDKLKKEWLRNVNPQGNALNNYYLSFDGVVWARKDINNESLEFDSYEVSQFTGLTDKNGKEIYEGDILRIGKDLIEEVKWIEVGNWMAEKQPMVGFISHGTIYKNSPIEIIGNIYENPELNKYE